MRAAWEQFERAQAAAELANLMDMVETEAVSLESLSTLVPEAYSEHWQKTIQCRGEPRLELNPELVVFE